MKIKTATVIENPSDEQVISALRAEFGVSPNAPKLNDIVRIAHTAPPYVAGRLGIVIGEIDSDQEVHVGSYDDCGDRAENYINVRYLTIVLSA